MATKRKCNYETAEKQLTDAGIKFTKPTAGHYLIETDSEKCSKLVYYPRSGIMHLHTLEGALQQSQFYTWEARKAFLLSYI